MLFSPTLVLFYEGEKSPEAFARDNVIKEIYMFDRFITYLKETRLEMRKVQWPTRKEAVRFTVTVIIVSLGLALVLGGFDFIFTRFIAILI